VNALVWCESALVDGRPQRDVLIDIVDGRFATISADAEPGTATRLSGFTMPGMANAHSHAFHRALRSRTQADRGTFWTWRDLMYRAAERLEPDSYHRLARAVFAEMALAGVSCVGEFHYLHHRVNGGQYADPNEMGLALLAAADDVGIRITLLDTLYLYGGIGADGYNEPVGTQQRFSDGTASRWADRVDRLASGDTHRIGAAIHSVRAVDPQSMVLVADWAVTHQAPLHAHVSEQVAENETCTTYHGSSPIEVLAASGVLTDSFSAVHATHLSGHDIERLAAAASTVVMCPTTERDLGDGIGPTSRFADAGIKMSLGSDSHAVIDLFEEARAVELDERLRSNERGIHAASDLLDMATMNGHRSLGWNDAGAIAVGNRADLVTIRLDSVRTAGTTTKSAVETAVFAGTAADVTDVHVDGRRIVAEGRHSTVDVAGELDATIMKLMDDA
jgi:formiminoglutamate deiminase|tara:strand:+ start:474 stop:1817 length:1344 start_codon:yes stop_codon:yes gene_type:complete